MRGVVDHVQSSGGTDDRRRTTSPHRADQIRQAVAVLSDSFRTSYLEWFARLGAQDLGEEDVTAILDAAVAELNGMQVRCRSGEITEAGLAYGREQIRDLLERVTRQHAVAEATKDHIGHLIIDSFQRRLLSSQGRYTQDWFSYHEPHWFLHFGHLAGQPGLQAVEVGSFEGRSACWILEHLLTGENSRLICIDTFQDYDDQERNFDYNTSMAGCADRIVKLRGRSQQVLPLLAEASFDFIYVDGSHLALDVLQDAAACWRLVRPGGIIVFDDYEHPLFPDSFGMSAGPAIDAFLSMLRGSYELIFKDWQMALRKGGGEPGPKQQPGAVEEDRAGTVFQQ
jgi:SAM-dependent methyltransferase